MNQPQDYIPWYLIPPPGAPNLSAWCYFQFKAVFLSIGNLSRTYLSTIYEVAEKQALVIRSVSGTITITDDAAFTDKMAYTLYERFRIGIFKNYPSADFSSAYSDIVYPVPDIITFQRYPETVQQSDYKKHPGAKQIIGPWVVGPGKHAIVAQAKVPALYTPSVGYTDVVGIGNFHVDAYMIPDNLRLWAQQ